MPPAHRTSQSGSVGRKRKRPLGRRFPAFCQLFFSTKAKSTAPPVSEKPIFLTPEETAYRVCPKASGVISRLFARICSASIAAASAASVCSCSVSRAAAASKAGSEKPERLTLLPVTKFSKKPETVLSAEVIGRMAT